MDEKQVKMLTTAEAAAILGTSPLKVERAIRQGLPIGFVIEPEPGTRENVRILIPEARLTAWLMAEDMKPVLSIS